MAELSPLLKQATPVVASRGEGLYLYDADGRSYLDFTAGIGVTSTGHCHPKVVAAAQAQVGTLIHGQYTTVLHPPILELTEKLGEVLPEGLDRVFYLNSGSEAVEASIRLARQATGKQTIIAFQGGFHGRTMGAASVTTSGVKVRAGIGPLMGGVALTPFPEAYRHGWSTEQAVEFALAEFDHLLTTVASPADTAAILIEPVMGEGGYIPAPDAFLRGLRQRANDHGLLLIVDEVQTGVGRTGTFWGHQTSGIRPDILITAKGLGSGFPISAIAASEELMAKGWPGSQGGTYGGNAVAAAAAKATLEVVLDDDLPGNAAKQGEALASGLRSVAADYPVIGDVRGKGLMLANEFTTPDGKPDTATAVAVHKKAAENGLLLLTCGPYNNIVRMIPALVLNDEHVEQALDLWRTSVSQVAG